MKKMATVVRRGSALKRWGAKLVRRIGAKKAIVLHAIWTDGSEFQAEGHAHTSARWGKGA